MSAPLFDAKQVRRAFSRSAGSYDAAAQLQHAVEARLLESLDYLDDPALKREAPQRVHEGAQITIYSHQPQDGEPVWLPAKVSVDWRPSLARLLAPPEEHGV